MKLPHLPAPRLPGRVAGLPPSARALLLARLGRPFVAVCRGEEEALRLHGDLAFFAAALGAPPPVLLPAREERLRAGRLAALERIAAGDAAAVVADLEAAASPLWAAERLRAAAVGIARGAGLDAAFLAELLAEMGYRRVQVVADAGEFAVREGRLDLFPAAAAHPLRVEHAAGLVTALRAFDVGTQRSFRDLPAATLLPAREPEEGTTLFAALPGHLVATEGDLGPDAARLPRVDLLLLDNPSPPEGEGRVRGEPCPVPPSPLGGDLPPAPPSPLGGEGRVRGVTGLGLTAPERKRSGESLADLGTRLAALAAGHALRKGGHALLVAAETLGEAERVRDLLAAAGAAAEILAPAALAAHPGPIAIVHGRLSSGFVDAESGFVALTSAELFGPRTPARTPLPSRVATLIASLDELEPGDYVVHVDHGIGCFVGVERGPGGGEAADFLRLEYAGGASLLLPVERIDLVRRYRAAGAGSPRLDAIGGASWRKAKGRTETRVREMARELLAQHAARATAAGFAFPPDDGRHREFADAFPFEETPDQRAAIDEVRADMESPRPMDRLLCGDVGYGKTEVAMRAAFKAAACGKQVALIAPTTVLAEQHAASFAARFAPFPMRVESLTRFTPAAEEAGVLARLAAGETAIVVGTHRLLGKDVRFRDLGLLVVDEEQKFGVAHKERIRQLREGVDVLTLTATPIPRTLNFALVGLREVSTLATAPEERLAVKTLVARFDRRLVREALEREFARGGQAFFVHNRIESIARVGAMLGRLLPGRRIDVAHARMPPDALEEAMHRFHAGETDLLLATSIVGAGLDVPRANTIVVDRADCFGLADLYQLKGRVGRAGTRAFAYFLVPHEDRITPEARLRLDALTELSYLGAGFRVALRDLEIRGAGDLLGGEQSGNIAAVGFDLYVEMLERAVAELRGGGAPPAPDPALELRVAAHLPASWVDEPALRFSVLRKVAAARDAAAVADLRRELADRFGPPPLAAARLLDLAELRAACRAAGVASLVEVADRRYRVLFAEGVTPPAGMVADLTRDPRVRFLPEGGFEIDLAKRSWEEVLQVFKRVLALTPAQVAASVRASGLATPAESAAFIRADRDAR